jgi:uncharacterized protein (TIGR00255 family)
MTGFARNQGTDGLVNWIWELKSVNGRGLEIRTRLPPGLDAIEAPTREAAARVMKRGNVNINLTIQRESTPGAIRINESILASLAGFARDLQNRFPHFEPPRLDGLLALKGVIETGEEAVEEEATLRAREAALLRDLEKAVTQLSDARLSEGAKLAKTLQDQLAEIESLARRAGACSALRPETLRARLRQQMSEILEAVPTLSEERLAQELALLVARGDVREELDRLAAHIAAARELLALGGAVGRRLDFLCQEFNREANTLCSKSGDVELTRIGLDLKAVIEQFREQVQNIE